MKKKILVEGMSYAHCVYRVSEILKDIGAKDVEVNFKMKFATAEISEDITDHAIKLALENVGYDVVGIEKA